MPILKLVQQLIRLIRNNKTHKGFVHKFSDNVQYEYGFCILLIESLFYNYMN